MMKKRVMAALIRNEEEAISACTSGSSMLLTYLIWAFFSSALLVSSKMPVIVRNRAHMPIWSTVSLRVSSTRLMNPKKVSENRWKKV